LSAEPAQFPRETIHHRCCLPPAAQGKYDVSWRIEGGFSAAGAEVAEETRFLDAAGNH
jgi:hypothetical protein